MHRTRARVIDQVSSVPDNVLFVVIFIIGALGICLLRLAVDVPSFIAVSVPLLLMILYVYVVWKTERFRLREDRAADNIYYLGFLFTVTTLGVALVRYGMSEAPDVNDIISDLGVGLVTTIAGLVGRIFMGQLRQDPEEIEEQTRLMLTASVDQTRSKLIQTNEVFDDIHSQTIQIMRNTKELLDVSNKGVISSIKRLEKKIDNIDIPADIVSKKLDSLFVNIEQSVNNFVEGLEAVDVPRDLISAKIDPAIGYLEGSVKNVVSKIDAIRVDPDLLNAKVENIISPLRVTLDTLCETLKSTDNSFSDLALHREEITKFAEVAETLGQEKQRIASWGEAITNNENHLNQVNGDLAQLHSSLESSVRLIKALGDMSSQQQDSYGKSVEELARTIADTQNSIRELSETTQSLGNNFAQAMNELVQAANSNASGSRIA